MTAIIVASSVVSSGNVLNSGDTETVLSGGISFDTTVNNGAMLTVSSGGLDEFATINGGGSETVFGSASATTINNGGRETVSAFGYVNGATVTSGGLLTALSGGTAVFSTISNGGALVASPGGITFATAIQNGGSLTVFSSGRASSSTVNSGGVMTVSSGGTAGSDTINDGGLLSVTAGGSAGAELINSGGQEIVAAGGSAGGTSVGGSLAVLAGAFAAGTIVLNGGKATFAGIEQNIIVRAGGQATISSGATVSLLSVSGAAAVLSGATVTSGGVETDGALVVSSGGSIAISAVVNGGSLTASSGGTIANAFIQGSGSLLDLQSGAVASGGITFFYIGGQLEIDGTAMPSNTISGFVSGDLIDLSSIAFDAAGSAVIGSGNVLHVTEGGVTYDLNMSLAQFYGAFHLSPDSGSGTQITEDPVCFCRGTLILTERGEVPVEDLAVGDRVKTLSGAAQPIVWIGLGRDLVTRRNSLARPIIVRRGALADNVPTRDLYLTHGHALYLDGALIPVENLVNHRSILWDEEARMVEYYHIELAAHDVVLANGAPAESYYDASNRALFHNTRPGSVPGEAKPSYAPVLNGSAVVEEAWATLFKRAGGSIMADTTDDPDPHLVVDGRWLGPAIVEDDTYSFAIASPPTEELSLRSHSGVPSLLGITTHDHRRLGIAIRRIVISQLGVATAIEHDAPLLLAAGCHPAEQGYCWTDGELTLPLHLFAHLSGAFAFAVHTERPGMRYPLPSAAAAVA